jgi:hypothetical protein
VDGNRQRWRRGQPEDDVGEGDYCLLKNDSRMTRVRANGCRQGWLRMVADRAGLGMAG